MKLSIIIPSYNTKNYLLACINSIFRETSNLDYEIIVVDNGSKYNIKKQIFQIKNKIPKLIINLIQNKKNLGFAKACNQGIKIAKGKYVLFLNSDTLIIDKAINKAINVMTSKKEIDVLGCQLLNPDYSLQPSAGYFPKLRQIFYMMFFIDDIFFINRLIKPYHQQRKDFYLKEQEVDWVTGAFLMAKKEVIDAVAGFDEDYFMYEEEVDLCYRLKEKGFRIFYSPQAKVIHYKQGSAKELSADAIIAEYKGLIAFFKKYKPSWEEKFLRLLLAAGAYLRIIFFGILLGDERKRKIYRQALQLAR